MNCSETREKLFASDSLSQGLPPALASHLGACPACRALRLKLVRLESAARSLPVLTAGSDAKEKLLRQLQSRRPAPHPLESPLRLLLRRNWQAKAVAAAVGVVIGGTLWLGLLRHARQVAETTPHSTDSTASSPQAGSPQAGPTGSPNTGSGRLADSSVVDKLVDLNVDMADAATPAERNQIFAEQAEPLTATLKQDHLAPKDQQLASTLLENGKWLSSNTDPLDEAERFDNVAGLLFDQLQDAAPAADPKSIGRLTHRYGLVAARLEEARAKLAKSSALSPERKRRYETLIRRQSQVEQKLQELLQRAPEMSRKEIRKELDIIGKPGKRKRQGWN